MTTDCVLPPFSSFFRSLQLIVFDHLHKLYFLLCQLVDVTHVLDPRRKSRELPFEVFDAGQHQRRRDIVVEDDVDYCGLNRRDQVVSIVEELLHAFENVVQERQLRSFDFIARVKFMTKSLWPNDNFDQSLSARLHD